MAYCDGFVLPLPTSKLDEYRAQAALAGQVWVSTARSNTVNGSPTTSSRASIPRSRRASNSKTAKPSSWPGQSMSRAAIATPCSRKSCKTRAWPT